MRAVWKGRGLAAVRRCYAEEGSDCYAKLSRWGSTLLPVQPFKQPSYSLIFCTI